METPSNNLNKLKEKSRLLGHFSFTYEDHRLMGSSSMALKENPGKAYYEILTIEEIERELDNMLEFAISEAKSVAGAGKRHKKQELLTAIAFLKSVNKLPEKYSDEEMPIKIQYDLFEEI